VTAPGSYRYRYGFTDREDGRIDENGTVDWELVGWLDATVEVP
jgi:hypothetical protein